MSDSVVTITALAVRFQFGEQDFVDAGVHYRKITLHAGEGVMAYGLCAHQGMSIDDHYDTNNLALNLLPTDWLLYGPLSVALNLETLIRSWYVRGPARFDKHIKDSLGVYDEDYTESIFEALNNISPHAVMCTLLTKLEREIYKQMTTEDYPPSLRLHQPVTARMALVQSMLKYARAALHAARPLYEKYFLNRYPEGCQLCACANTFDSDKNITILRTYRQVSRIGCRRRHTVAVGLYMCACIRLAPRARPPALTFARVASRLT